MDPTFDRPIGAGPADQMGDLKSTPTERRKRRSSMQSLQYSTRDTGGSSRPRPARTKRFVEVLTSADKIQLRVAPHGPPSEDIVP
jgi:hypothetical protein